MEPPATTPPAVRDPAGPLVAFVPDLLWTPHFETILEVVQTHLDAGGRAVVLHCDGELPTCLPNPQHVAPICTRCRRRFASGMRWLRGTVTAEPCFALTNQDLAVVDELASQLWHSLDELAAVTLGGADIGAAALSALVDWTGEPAPDIHQHQQMAASHLAAAAMTYLSCRARLLAHRPCELAIFNGRLPFTRPAVRAAQELGVDVTVYEVAGSLDRYVGYRNALPHDYESNAAYFDAAPSVLTDGDRADALRWFDERREGVTHDWPSYTAEQAPGLLPDALGPEAFNVVIFNSSESEWVGFGDWRNPLYPTQHDAVVQLLNDLADQERIRVFLRVHPNLRWLGQQQAAEIDALRRTFPSLTVIAADSPVSSYALMDAADAVITYGSTMGIEAAYAGKTSILMGRASFEDFDVCIRPDSHEALMLLLRQLSNGHQVSAPRGRAEGLVRWAVAQRRTGTPYKYVRRTGFFTTELHRDGVVERLVEGNRPERCSSYEEVPTAANVSWHAEGAEEVEVRVNRADGPLLARGGKTGTTRTGPWIRDGLRLLLVAGPGVFATVGFFLTDGRWQIRTGAITLRVDADHGRAGTFGLRASWTSTGATHVELRHAAPDGPLVGRSGPMGECGAAIPATAETCFYLQDVSGGATLSADNTLACATVSVNHGQVVVGTASITAEF